MPRTHRDLSPLFATLVFFAGNTACSDPTTVTGAAPDSSILEDASTQDADASGWDSGPDTVTEDADGHDATHDADDAAMDGPGDAASDVPTDIDDGGSDGSEDGPSDADDDVAEAGDDAADAGWLPRPVCYQGDFDTDGLHESGCVMPGPIREVVSGAGTAGVSIGAAAVSPDGQSLAMAIRQSASTKVSIRLVSIEGTTAPVQLAEAPSLGREVDQMGFSSDGAWLAFIADFDLEGTRSLYTVPASGGILKRVSPNPQAGKEVTGMAWARPKAPDSRWLAFTGDLTTDGIQSLWTVEAGTSVPAPVPVVGDSVLGADADVQPDITWDAARNIIFRSNLGPDGTWALYRVSADGSVIESVANSALTNPQGPSTIGSYGLSPDGWSVAFSANSPSADVFEVWVTNMKSSGPAVRVSAASAVAPTSGLSGPAFQLPIAWSRDGTKLAAVADWRLSTSDHDDNFSVFVLPTTAPAGGIRLLGAPQSPDRNVRELKFTDEGALVVRGDLVANGDFELFYLSDLTSQDQDPSSVLFEETPDQGDVLGIATGP